MCFEKTTFEMTVMSLVKFMKVLFMSIECIADVSVKLLFWPFWVRITKNDLNYAVKNNAREWGYAQLHTQINNIF